MPWIENQWTVAGKLGRESFKTWGGVDGGLEATIDGRHGYNRRSRNHNHQQNSSKSNQIDERFSQGATLNLQELGSKLEVSLVFRVNWTQELPKQTLLLGTVGMMLHLCWTTRRPPFSRDSTIFYNITWTKFCNPAVFKHDLLRFYCKPIMSFDVFWRREWNDSAPALHQARVDRLPESKKVWLSNDPTSISHKSFLVGFVFVVFPFKDMSIEMLRHSIVRFFFVLVHGIDRFTQTWLLIFVRQQYDWICTVSCALTDFRY